MADGQSCANFFVFLDPPFFLRPSALFVLSSEDLLRGRPLLLLLLLSRRGRRRRTRREGRTGVCPRCLTAACLLALTHSFFPGGLEKGERFNDASAFQHKKVKKVEHQCFSRPRLLKRFFSFCIFLPDFYTRGRQGSFDEEERKGRKRIPFSRRPSRLLSSFPVPSFPLSSSIERTSFLLPTA